MISSQTTTFRTESGSVYELDLVARRLRRLSGNAPPTRNQANDGEWKQFHSISEIEVGERPHVVWEFDGLLRTTLMSRVVEIIGN